MLSNTQIKIQWFKQCSNPFWYKVLVLLDIVHIPSLEEQIKARRG